MMWCGVVCCGVLCRVVMFCVVLGCVAVCGAVGLHPCIQWCSRGAWMYRCSNGGTCILLSALQSLHNSHRYRLPLNHHQESPM